MEEPGCVSWRNGHLGLQPLDRALNPKKSRARFRSAKEPALVAGHDFSRAKKAQSKPWALTPEERPNLVAGPHGRRRAITAG